MSRRATPETFWAKVDRSGGPDACWPWLKYRSKFGQGITRWHGHRLLAHRVAYWLTYGPLPDALYVLHHCDNPPCCNPAHLFTGVQADNVADMVKKGRMYRKLTDDQVREIRAARYPQWVLAERYGISQTQISYVIHKRTWRHIT